MTTTPETAARAAQDSPVFRTVARVGYVVLGIVHIVIGVIAISIATGGSSTHADQSGAMAQIHKAPLGVLLLWVIGIGLLALAIWQFIQAFLERNPDAKKRWGQRAYFVGSGLAYLAIAWISLIYALGGQTNSAQSSKSASADLMATPGGVFLVVLIGLIVAAIGIAFIVRGITRSFAKRLNLPPDPVRKGVLTFAVVGYIAKGIAITIAGALFIAAAVTHDPQKAGGLDTALRTLAGLPFGALILWIVGLGLIIYGVYCFARAKYARM